MVAGVVQQEDHDIDSTVALLQRELAFEGLNVADPRLGLHPK